MSEPILILSRCLKRGHDKKWNSAYYKFHFKGFYLGIKIKEVWVYVKEHENSSCELKEDYLLWVEYSTIETNILKGKLIKARQL